MAAAAAAAVATGVTELLTAKTTGIRTVRPDHNTTQGRFVLNQNTFSFKKWPRYSN